MAINKTVEFESFNVAPDASGIVGCAYALGFKFQFSWLGDETNVRILTERGSFRGSKQAAALVERAVTARVLSETTPEYRAATVAMYSEP